MRILLVEDEMLLRTSLARLLQRAGFEVQAVGSAGEALATQPAFAADLLITDWLLQGDCDGLELARRLRRTTPAIQVIVITGLLAGDARPQLEPEALGATLLEKPFLFADLLAAIERIRA
jgi:two-component system, cell cycle response regulator CpdR